LVAVTDIRRIRMSESLFDNPWDVDVGFTGTQVGMTAEQKGELREGLSSLISRGRRVRFHEGDCIGADAEAAAIARELGCWIVSHPPSDPKKRAFFKADEERKPKPYLVRNGDIVTECSIVYAAPRNRVEQFRGSGTWTTVRYARRANRLLVMLFGGI
jgi:hypothetical protein